MLMQSKEWDNEFLEHVLRFEAARKDKYKVQADTKDASMDTEAPAVTTQAARVPQASSSAHPNVVSSSGANPLMASSSAPPGSPADAAPQRDLADAAQGEGNKLRSQRSVQKRDTEVDDQNIEVDIVRLERLSWEVCPHGGGAGAGGRMWRTVVSWQVRLNRCRG